MLFFIRCKPALSWMMVFTLAYWAQCASAQLAASGQSPFESGGRLALDADELKWIRDNPRVVVASMQFPLYLFKDEHGRWNGLTDDILRRIQDMTGLEFVHRESFSPIN